MADTTINPRYLKYNKKEVEQLLDKVSDQTEATEQSVRSIVKNWLSGSEQEPGT